MQHWSWLKNENDIHTDSEPLYCCITASIFKNSLCILKGNSSENIISVEIHSMESVYTITRNATFLVNKCVHIQRKSKLNTSQNLQSAILNQLLPVAGMATWWHTWGYSSGLRHSFLPRSEQKKLVVLKLNSRVLHHNLIRRLPWQSFIHELEAITVSQQLYPSHGRHLIKLWRRKRKV